MLCLLYTSQFRELTQKVQESRSRVCALPRWERLVVQHYVEQRAMDLQAALDSAGVVDEPQFPEPVHEETDAGTGLSLIHI